MCRLNSIRTSAFPTKEKTTLFPGQLRRERTLQTTGEGRQFTRPTRGFQRQRSSVCPDSTSPLTSFSGLIFEILCIQTLSTSNFQLGYSFYWCTHSGRHEVIRDYTFILEDWPVRKCCTISSNTYCVKDLCRYSSHILKH